MKKKLAKEKKVVLYGAGTKCHSVYKVLIANGYIVAYCVITSECIEGLDFEDIKVYSFRDKIKEIIEKEYQVVIAVGANYEADIVKNIIQTDINEFWKLSELPWCIDFDKFKKLDSTEYINIIKQKYLSDLNKYENIVDVKKFIREVTQIKTNGKKIIFLIVHISPRAYKIIDALHRRGYTVNVIIWMNAMGMTKDIYREYSEISDWCVLSNDFEEIMMYCAATDAKILHIFSHADTNLELTQTLIHCKSIFPSIVFDEYDVYVEMRNHISNKIIDAELFCLKNADGLCSRYTCMEALEEKGYDICKKRIYFLDCCNDFSNYESLQKIESDELSLVYAGTLLTDKAYETSKVIRFLEFAEICKENNTHLHIYPTFYDEARLYEYIELEKRNPYFHMHQPVSVLKLAQEISQYDYGVTSAKKDFLDWDNEEGIFTKELWKYCATNKLYDYLDAGLPIVSAYPVGQAKKLEEEGVLIRKVDEEINFDELRRKRNDMKKRVIEVREKYKISNQLPKLIDFYDSL